MNTIKKAIRYFGFLGVFLILLLWTYSCASIPKLSKENKAVIREVLKSPVPEMVTGETGFAQSGAHRIWHEKISTSVPKKGTILLIMGNGQDALSWPPDFINHLTKAGYEVIRYDHRGTGLSKSDEKWDRKNPYTLNDIADDAVAILDTLSTEEVHVVGASMGGMIAQIIAIEHPERIKTLTSIMSSGNVLDDELPPMSDEVLPKMISAILNHGFFGSKKGQIKRQVVQKRILMGEATGDIDVKTMAETSLYNLKERDGYKLMAARHHYAAILEAPSRYDGLKQLKIPTLIVHGKEDPVMPIEHGKKMAGIIPNADSLFIDKMGHDLPDHALKTIADGIIENCERTSK